MSTSRLGARFVDFGGMGDAGAVRGHARRASPRCGPAAGAFDVSHLGRFDLTRSRAPPLSLRRLLCNDIATDRPRTSPVHDDAQPSRRRHRRHHRVAPGRRRRTWCSPTGPTTTRVVDAFAAVDAGTSSSVARRRGAPRMLAVQGPDSPAIIEAVAGRTARIGSACSTSRGATGVLVAGTGYTGERGAELVVLAPRRARRCSTPSSRRAPTPSGLGARDTLRLEMGYPLWGQDLDTCHQSARGRPRVGRRLGPRLHRPSGSRGRRAPMGLHAR